jgi:molybdopterin/thiamine biosynthesis adenylyltransferase
MELAALKKAGIPHSRDDEWFRKGILKLFLQPTVAGETLDLVAIYPQLFPYFRFQVYARNLRLSRHQNPFEGNLCLIGRSTSNWHTTDTLANFMTDPTRLPALLTSARSKDRAAVSHLEEAQAEPFSDYYMYASNSMLVVDGGWQIPSMFDSGELEVVVQSAGQGYLRGIVKTVKGPNNSVLAEADNAITLGGKKIVRARWLRVKEPLKAPDGAGLLRLIERQKQQIASPRWKSVENCQTDVIGILFPEELQEGVVGDGWVFVVRQGRKGENIFAVRAGRYSRADSRARIPELSALSEKRVALFGLGGIGAPAAIEFARGGIGQLNMLEYDFVDPGTGVRWPLGLGAAGLLKSSAVPGFIAEHYPFTSLRTWTHRIGDVVLQPDSQEPRDFQLLNDILQETDLVFDATAEPGIHHLLCDLAWARRIPYLTAYTTLGARGGLVARLDPRRPTGCWVCLQRALYQDRTIREPPFDENGNVQPLGCADPTFTGASFDVIEVVVEAIRVAIGTLCAGMKGSYPESPWDVAVLSLRDANGQRVLPQWDQYQLAPWPECQCTRA